MKNILHAGGIENLKYLSDEKAIRITDASVFFAFGSGTWPAVHHYEKRTWCISCCGNQQYRGYLCGQWRPFF
jgi:hypothetical protein